MNKIKEMLRKFMSGRYGMDRLNTILMVAAIVMMILGSFIQHPVPNSLAFILMSISIFRTYSRNISKRRKENEQIMRVGRLIKRNLALLKLKFKEVRNHRFRTCPNCRVVIRTSTKRGKRTLSCPKCGTEFETRIMI